MSMGFRNSIFGISEIELADARDVIAPARGPRNGRVADRRQPRRAGGRAGGDKL